MDPTLLLSERPPTSSRAAATAAAACARRTLSGELASAMTGALYASLVTMELAGEAELQRDIFRLRDREYPYYFENNKDRLPRVPDLSDLSGGMSNPTYFNFNFYCLWKVAARRANTPELRARLTSEYGRQLLPRVWAQSSSVGGARAPPSALLRHVTQLLDALLEQGYMCGYQVVWGEVPGDWPADWMVSQPRVAGLPAVEGDDARGLVFQVKLHQPADIAGSVALRAEEDGYWSRAVSSMMSEVLQHAGYESVCDEYFFQDEWSGPTDAGSRLLLFFGDPLEMVDVPFVPSTLVQNWILQ